MLNKYLTCKTRLRHYNEGEETIVARLNRDVPENNVLITEYDENLRYVDNTYVKIPTRPRRFLAGEIAERLYEYEQLGYSPEELKMLIARQHKDHECYRAHLEAYHYLASDVEATIDLSDAMSKTIKNVIFNDPATIVFWMDGTKTVVKAQFEEFDPEKGLAMAITKKFFGNKGNYCNEIKKWTEKYWAEQTGKGCHSIEELKNAVVNGLAKFGRGFGLYDAKE